MPRRSGERGGCPPWSSRRQAFPEPVRLTFVAEADGDLLTVVAVGATNSIRRRYLGLQSGLHTLIGGVLAVPLTLLLYKTVMMAGGGYQTVGNFGVWDSARLILPWSGLVLFAAWSSACHRPGHRTGGPVGADDATPPNQLDLAGIQQRDHSDYIAWARAAELR